MSDTKPFSPLLDGFILGSAMSDHDGVRCYPAMKENSESKYIVKIISIPASQVQLDALLLTGAYKAPADAMDYFKTVSDGVMKEAEILQKLGKLEGFLPYESWQAVPMESGKLGYEVCLVSPYKRSLEKYMRRHLMTHLEAVNLGLDLCAALAICRRAGFLYIDLKPGNIFLTKGKEYRIGDLGFAELDSLQYTSLPGKYRSPYSPPEIQDALNTLNSTADTYSVGMILYQIYNDGKLPHIPAESEEPIPTPVNADYEIAEIIMKAIAPDPKDRWQDPMQMGQALVAYMQRNSINDVPITPPAAVITDAEPVLEETQRFPVIDGIVNDDTAPSEEDTEGVTVTGEVSSIFAEADDLLNHETPEGVVVPEHIELPEPEPIPPQPEPVPEAAAEEPAAAQTAPAADSAEEDDEDDDFSIAFEARDEEPAAPEEAPEEIADVKPIRERKTRKSFGKGWLAPIAAILVLALIAAGGFWFYQNQYLQTINFITVDGTQNQLIVSVDTDVDDSLLTVICTDTYGNPRQQILADGQAVFTDLLPNSQYKIQLEISGFHKLVGQTSDVFNTQSQTSIVSFSAVTGPEDGSAVLTFTVNGAEPDEWTVTCTAPSQPTITETFTGHNVTIKGLTVDQVYTFQLSDGGDQELLGQSSLEFTASRLVLADNLTISKSTGTEMTVHWDTPEGAVVESWYVRCYNDSGYDESQELTGNEAVFSGIDHANAYTVEVTASGMTQPARATISANPITITSLNVNADDPAQLTLSWEFEGSAPEGGWHVMYSLDGSEALNVVQCSEASAVITPRIPSAAYEFVIQAADGTSIFSNIHSYECPGAQILEMQGLSAEKITAHLLKTPDGEWAYENVGDEAFTDQFASGDKISMVLHANTDYYINEEDISLLFVIRDGSGDVISSLISQEAANWRDLWYGGDYHYAELDIPQVPTEAGNYSLSLYINNAAVTVITFSIA